MATSIDNRYKVVSYLVETSKQGMSKDHAASGRFTDTMKAQQSRKDNVLEFTCEDNAGVGHTTAGKRTRSITPPKSKTDDKKKIKTKEFDE